MRTKGKPAGALVAGAAVAVLIAASGACGSNGSGTSGQPSNQTGQTTSSTLGNSVPYGNQIDRARDVQKQANDRSRQLDQKQNDYGTTP